MATFHPRTILAAPNTAEKPSVTLETPIPTLIHVLALLTMPDPARTRIAVSDLHADISDADFPPLTNRVTPARPRLDPSTLTKLDPVATKLLRRTLLTRAICADRALVIVPGFAPTLIHTRPLPATPDAPLQTTPLSDTHLVPSQAVLSNLAAPVADPRPIPAPCTVTLADPLDPALPALNTLIRPLSEDTPLVRLPTALPDVISTRRLPCAESPARTRTDVSESQPDCSQLDRDPLMTPDAWDAPMLAPCSDSIADPVAAAFGLRTELTVPSRAEKASVALVMLVLVVINMRRLLAT